MYYWLDESLYIYIKMHKEFDILQEKTCFFPLNNLVEVQTHKTFLTNKTD